VHSRIKANQVYIGLSKVFPSERRELKPEIPAFNLQCCAIYGQTMRGPRQSLGAEARPPSVTAATPSAATNIRSASQSCRPRHPVCLRGREFSGARHR
jgi:hypothetical protein